MTAPETYEEWSARLERAAGMTALELAAAADADLIDDALYAAYAQGRADEHEDFREQLNPLNQARWAWHDHALPFIRSTRTFWRDRHVHGSCGQPRLLVRALDLEHRLHRTCRAGCPNRTGT